MGSNIFFQIFIYFDIFLIGVLSSIAFRHAYVHFKPHAHELEKPELSQKTKEQMLHAQEEQYQAILDRAVKKLETDLNSSSDQINGLVKRFAGEIVGQEMESYRKGLAELHVKTQQDLSGIRQAVSGHEAEIEAQFTKEMEVKRQFMLQQIDTKLGDAVASFLLETLGHNVDLGGQNEYLLQMLEEHKDDFKAGVSDDNKPA